MKADKALLLDLNGVAGLSLLGVSLRTILEPHFSIDILTASDYDSAATNFGDNLNKTIRQLNPALIFFLISPHLVNKTSKLMELTKDIPTILVIEGSEPNEVFELLKIGARDFITSPLRASDVLPRTWRLLSQPASEEMPAETLKAELGLH